MKIGADLSGQVIGKLKVIRRSYETLNGCKLFFCICECGKEKLVTYTNLSGGHTRSCGCLYRTRGGFSVKSKHSRHVLYGRWKGMHRRCNDPKLATWERYGGRGIKVCERWNDFSHFLADMEPSFQMGLTLERIDNDGNYEPSNCKWATYAEQNENKSDRLRKNSPSLQEAN